MVGSKGIASGVVIRPDRQSPEEIHAFLDSLPGYQEDIQRQRRVIPEWALNRGGKTVQSVEFTNPPAGGIAAKMSAILVSEWVTNDDTIVKMLLHPNVSGIIAEKGGKTSHALVVAREKNVPVLVNVPEGARIQAGDYLTFDAATGIINVNGGDPNYEATEAIEAEEPIYAFVWSSGQGIHADIVPGSEGAVPIHMELAEQGMNEGWFDFADNGMGVIYQDGKAQIFARPSDYDRMIEWLNTIHPITEIE